MTALSHDQATTVLDAARRAIVANGGGAAAAVVDDHGELMAFFRSDGCPLPSIGNAINKAFTSARERVASADLGRASRDEGFPLTNFGDLRYTGWGGGVPIVVAGEVVGAIGVSGLPEATDIAIAAAAAAALDS